MTYTKQLRLEADEDCIILADAIADRIGQARYSLWFAGKTRIKRKGKVALIGVPSAFQRDFLKQTFVADIKELLRAIGMTADFVVDPELAEAAAKRMAS